MTLNSNMFSVMTGIEWLPSVTLQRPRTCDCNWYLGFYCTHGNVSQASIEKRRTILQCIEHNRKQVKKFEKSHANFTLHVCTVQVLLHLLHLRGFNKRSQRNRKNIRYCTINAVLVFLDGCQRPSE